jgi:hypothetical protein
MVPVCDSVAPVIAALNGHEIRSLLAAAKAAKASWAYTEIVRLVLTVALILEERLEQNVPGKRCKIEGRIRMIRGGNCQCKGGRCALCSSNRSGAGWN